MSTTYFPCNIPAGKRNGRRLFCFNPYPLDAINDKIAVEGYLTSDFAKQLLNGWGADVLKQCYRDKRRNIIEDLAVWPFFGLHINECERGESLYDFLKNHKYIN